MSAHDFGALCLFCFRETGDGVSAEADADAVRREVRDALEGAFWLALLAAVLVLALALE